MSKKAASKEMKTLIKAQQGEVDAVWMYRRLAKRVKDVDDALAFIRLANDEQRHADVFRKHTGKKLRAMPFKALFVPLMYAVLGKEKVYPIIARAEYSAAEKYAHIISEYPEVETIMNDETIHGDAVMGLLK